MSSSGARFHGNRTKLKFHLYKCRITLLIIMIKYIIVFLSFYFVWILYINIKQNLCLYNNTCARLKFTYKIIYVYDTNTLRLNYENQYKINTYLCKSMNDTYKNLLCNTKNTVYNNNFQKTQTVINKLYYNNYIICYNKNNIFNVTTSIDFFCSEIDNKKATIIDYIIISYTHHAIILLSCAIIINEYDKLYIIKKKINKYSEQIEYILDNCSICLQEYTPQDIIRKLKICVHRYHEHCINEWINTYNNDTCPICRSCIKL
jgi:hypothetical protein